MKSWFVKFNIGIYFIISCLVSIVDLLIALVLFKFANVSYLTACNVGIVTGFIIQYAACTKYVFKDRGFVSSIAVYLFTFLFGLMLADVIMSVSYSMFKLPFLVSKSNSMIVPFFITFFIRKKLLGVKTLGEDRVENIL